MLLAHQYGVRTVDLSTGNNVEAPDLLLDYVRSTYSQPQIGGTHIGVMLSSIRNLSWSDAGSADQQCSIAYSKKSLASSPVMVRTRLDARMSTFREVCLKQCAMWFVLALTHTISVLSVSFCSTLLRTCT